MLDLAGTTPPRPLRTDDEVVALAYAPVGHTLAGAGSVAVVWDTAGVPQQRAELAEPPVDGFTTISTALAFTPDGRRLAAAFEDGNAQVFDVARGAPEGLPVTGKKVSTLAFSPDGRTLALGSYLGETLLYDIAEPDGPTLVGALLAGEPGPRNFLVSLAFSPDSAILAATSGDGTAILWNTANRAAPTRIGAPFNAANGAAISDVTFSRDGTLLLCGERRRPSRRARPDRSARSRGAGAAPRRRTVAGGLAHRAARRAHGSGGRMVRRARAR